jgi:hypothetical protein
VTSRPPLRICFPRLYEVCNNQNISVAECAELGWQLRWKKYMHARMIILYRGPEYEDLEKYPICGLD